MDATTKAAAQIAVIGGGISGLAAAYRLSALRPDLRVVLYEASDRLGGVIQTFRDGQYLIERAADNFLRGPSAPWAEAWCEEIGFADQLIATNDANRGAHIYWNGRLYPVPAGFQLLAPARLWPILTSNLLSPWGRLRLCCEPLRAEPREERDESLRQFAERRLGRQAFERLVQPLVSGIYTADPDRLSVAAAVPQMVQLVRQHGSLYRGMRRQRRSAERQQTRGARYSLFVAPRGGMSDLVQAVADRLGTTHIRLRTRAHRLQRLPAPAAGWRVETEGDAVAGDFAAVILALPAPQAARILSAAEDAPLARELVAIEHASSAVVCLGYPRDRIQRRLDAFGCVVPAAAGRRVLAISYSSLKFPGRAPANCVLLRVFVGGALQPALAELPDSELQQLVREELATILGVSGAPDVAHVVRWPQAMPQYHVGHLDRVARIEQTLRDRPGLHLAGNGLRGVGIPQCVRSGWQAAEQVVAQLS